MLCLDAVRVMPQVWGTFPALRWLVCDECLRYTGGRGVRGCLCAPRRVPPREAQKQGADFHAKIKLQRGCVILHTTLRWVGETKQRKYIKQSPHPGATFTGSCTTGTMHYSMIQASFIKPTNPLDHVPVYQVNVRIAANMTNVSFGILGCSLNGLLL